MGSNEVFKMTKDEALRMAIVALSTLGTLKRN